MQTKVKTRPHLVHRLYLREAFSFEGQQKSAVPKMGRREVKRCATGDSLVGEIVCNNVGNVGVKIVSVLSCRHTRIFYREHILVGLVNIKYVKAPLSSVCVVHCSQGYIWIRCFDDAAYGLGLNVKIKKLKFYSSSLSAWRRKMFHFHKSANTSHSHHVRSRQLSILWQSHQNISFLIPSKFRRNSITMYSFLSQTWQVPCIECKIAQTNKQGSNKMRKKCCVVNLIIRAANQCKM